eukprot:COSAG06_NODE_4132_length_4539_cov_1.639189_3_plen_74_part_00
MAVSLPDPSQLSFYLHATTCLCVLSVPIQLTCLTLRTLRHTGMYRGLDAMKAMAGLAGLRFFITYVASLTLHS